jgi:hypothetical protein
MNHTTGLCAGVLLVALGGGCNGILGLEERLPIDSDAGSGGTGGTSGPGGGMTSGGGSCTDGTKNGKETGVDCGGPCKPCPDGDGCMVGPDCDSKVCVGGSCATPTCNDKQANGSETGVDCGGTGCPKCSAGSVCTKNADCKGFCLNGMCEPTCTDGEKSGFETGVDCGGPNCEQCPDGQACSFDTDCQSGVCKAAVCTNFLVWEKTTGDSNAQGATSVAVDTAGNVAVAGSFEGTISFGGQSLTSAGNTDIFVAKLTGGGSPIWSKRFGDAGNQNTIKIVEDSNGNTILGGTLTGTMNFGGGPLTASGLYDAFVAKLDGAGNHLFSKRFGDSSSQSTEGVAVNSAGEVLVTGSFAGTIALGGPTLSSVGNNDVFVAKLNSTGDHIWSHRYGGSSSDVATAISVDASGGVIVCGIFRGTVDFGKGPLVSAGGSDLFVLKLDADGTTLWSKRYGDKFDQSSPGQLAVDGSGNIVLAGGFYGAIDFGGSTLTDASDTADDFYVAKLDPLGGHVWSKSYGDADEQFNLHVAVDAADNVLLTGDLRGTVNFGGGALTSAGDADVFVVKLDPAGSQLWGRRFGDIQPQYGQAVAGYGAETVVVAGSFASTIDFGAGPIATQGLQDAFLVKLLTP